MGGPKLDRIAYRFLPDKNTLATQARTGEIDSALRLAPNRVQRLAAAPNLSFVKTPSGITGFIGFSTTKPPFNDPRVCLALRDAMDRRLLLATVYQGYGSILDDPVTMLDPFFGGGVQATGYDPVKAASLLDAARHRDAECNDGDRSLEARDCGIHERVHDPHLSDTRTSARKVQRTQRRGVQQSADRRRPIPRGQIGPWLADPARRERYVLSRPPEVAAHHR